MHVCTYMFTMHLIDQCLCNLFTLVSFGTGKNYSGGLQGPMLLLPRTAAPAVNNSEEVSCITAEHLELEKVHQEREPPVVFVHVFVHTMFWVNYSVNLMLYVV